MNRLRGVLTLLAVIAALAATASCSHNCTLMGGRGGFGIDIALPSYHPSPGDTITVCAASTCNTADVTSDHVDVEDNGALTFETPVVVTVTLIDSANTQIARGIASVTPEAWYPNGRDCAPRVLSAPLVIDQAGVHQTPQGVPQPAANSAG